MKNTVVYVRVSTMSQDVETQIVSLKDYAAKNGLEISQIYADRGVSGSRSSRPKLDAMLKDMRENAFDTILIYKLDRLGRSLSHLIDLMSEFRNKNVRLISATDGLDTGKNDNPMTRAFWALLGVFAEFEKEIIRERVKSGLMRAKAEGKLLGRRRGSRDKRKRSVSGYIRRFAGKSKEQRRLGPRRKKQVIMQSVNGDSNKTIISGDNNVSVHSDSQ